MRATDIIRGSWGREEGVREIWGREREMEREGKCEKETGRDSRDGTKERKK